ncbi:hypothetical protein ACQR1I_16530 [Bradyrhizobium sp. HKCCYLS2038]|uniref:hypothetical protein n=1 Tax=unclassified Bradyrhizobium TaxID=2631580 RepID=UPI003EC0BB73
MPVIPFGEYKPDVSDYEAGTGRNVLNVVPRADGYGPFPSLTALSQSLGAQCRGAIEATRTDGSVVVFAATATDLFLLNNTTMGWVRVSQGGVSYPAVSQPDQWRFVQFNSLVIAVQANVVPQVFDISSGSAFVNLAGNPPQARYIDVVGRFVVLTGLLTNPNRVQWSGLNDVNGPNSWTPGVNSSDYQDLADGGFSRGIAGGETGVILQDTIIRRMIYLPGDPRVFQIEKIAEGIGIYGPLSLVRAGATVFFYSLRGFHRIDPGGPPVPIGRERIDRTFKDDLDINSLQMFQGVADPRSSRILWAYKSVNGAANQFDKAICYDVVLDRFTPLKISGEILFQMAQPGVTLEALDQLAPGAMAILGAANNGNGGVRIQVASTANLPAYVSLSGILGTTEANGNWWAGVVDATHFDLYAFPNLTGGPAFSHAYTSGGLVGGSLDAMTQSLDNFAVTIQPELAAFDGNHILNFFRGPAAEAVLETAEQGTDGKRIKLKVGFRPVTDARVVYGSASRRETQQQSATAGNESLIHPVTGICNMLLDTRYSRLKCRIPAGTSWTFINGVEPADLSATGKR